MRDENGVGGGGFGGSREGVQMGDARETVSFSYRIMMNYFYKWMYSLVECNIVYTKTASYIQIAPPEPKNRRLFRRRGTMHGNYIVRRRQKKDKIRAADGDIPTPRIRPHLVFYVTAETSFTLWTFWARQFESNSCRLFSLIDRLLCLVSNLQKKINKSKEYIHAVLLLLTLYALPLPRIRLTCRCIVTSPRFSTSSKCRISGPC